MNFIDNYLNLVSEISKKLDTKDIDNLVGCLSTIKENNGRLFFIGIGGSAANCSHAVNDFRKLCGIEAYTPTDNVSEFSARTNDEGWDTVFSEWLKGSKLKSNDAIFVFSVGGGSVDKQVSVNLISAIDLAKSIGASIFSIVGRQDGYAAKNSDICIVVPKVSDELITPLSESFQSVVWHLLVSHPSLKENSTKW